MSLKIAKRRRGISLSGGVRPRCVLLVSEPLHAGVMKGMTMYISLATPQGPFKNEIWRPG